MAHKIRKTRKAVVEARYPQAGYVYSGDGTGRLGFSPLSTVKHTPPDPGEPLAVWQSNWGAPDKSDLPYMMKALQDAYPGREITVN